jgi:hypothetical protein
MKISNTLYVKPVYRPIKRLPKTTVYIAIKEDNKGKIIDVRV